MKYVGCTVRLLRGRVALISITYDATIPWESVDEFARYTAAKLQLGSAWRGKKGEPPTMTCADFVVRAEQVGYERMRLTFLTKEAAEALSIFSREVTEAERAEHSAKEAIEKPKRVGILNKDEIRRNRSKRTRQLPVRLPQGLEFLTLTYPNNPMTR